MGLQSPYASWNYVVELGTAFAPAKPMGGFQEVVGLIGGSYKVNDVTLKRGVVNSSDLWNWITQARNAGAAPRRNTTIILRDRAGNVVQSWKLMNATPVKYSGPPLNGTGNDVAMEELTLSAEWIELVPRK